MANRAITHPCDSWARSAGAQDWQEAVAKMKAGAVLAAPAPIGYKTLISMRQLTVEAEHEGLHLYVSEGGSAVLGFKENFPPEIVELEAREMRRLEKRMGMLRG